MIHHEKGLPIIGKYLSYRNNKIEFFQHLHKKHGDTFRVKIGGRTYTALLNPKDVEEVLITSAQFFNKNYNLDLLFGQNIVSSHGGDWKKMRTLMAPFFSKTYLEQELGNIHRITKKFMQKINILGIQDADLEILIGELSFEIILAIVIGEKFSEYKRELITTFKECTSYLVDNSYLNSVPLLSNIGRKKFDKNKMRIDEIVYGVIDEETENREINKSFVSYILQKFDFDPTPEDRLFLRDQIVTLFYAGFETTSIALSWLFWELSKHPNDQESCFECINKIDLTEESMNDLTALDPYILEGLRLHPPGWAWSRLALRDTQLTKVKIQKDEVVIILPYLNHRNEEHWENPNSFTPARFEKFSGFDGKFLPFSLGPRRCAGELMGMWEMRIVLYHLLKNFKLLTSSRLSIPKPQTTLLSEDGIHVKLEGRSSFLH